jgi:hypothetical protein
VFHPLDQKKSSPKKHAGFSVELKTPAWFTDLLSLQRHDRLNQ